MLAVWGISNGVITSQSITIWGHEETDLESPHARQAKEQWGRRQILATASVPLSRL